MQAVLDKELDVEAVDDKESCEYPPECPKEAKFLWIFKCCADGRSLCTEHKNSLVRDFNIMSRAQGGVKCPVHGVLPYKPSESYIIIPL